MIRSLFGIAALSVMLLAGNSWSADDAENRCQEWAKEDGVAAEEMQGYMEQCVAEQRLADAGADQETDDNKPGGASESKD